MMYEQLPFDTTIMHSHVKLRALPRDEMITAQLRCNVGSAVGDLPKRDRWKVEALPGGFLCAFARFITSVL